MIILSNLVNHISLLPRKEATSMKSRRDFLSLAALSIPTIGALLKNIEAATRNVAHLTPEQVAMDEDYWSVIQNSFTVTRGIVNLNNGGVSPSPRIVTEALVRYIWQQEDATAYTMCNCSSRSRKLFAPDWRRCLRAIAKRSLLRGTHQSRSRSF